MQFKDGDVVRLKSGGPLMTVENHRTDHMICVQWFSGHDPRRDVFHPDCLRKVGRAIPWHIIPYCVIAALTAWITWNVAYIAWAMAKGL